MEPRSSGSGLGSLGLAARLRRLGERLGQETGVLYLEHGIPLEPRWVPAFHELGLSEAVTVTDLASRLGCTHTAVVQVAGQMLRAGLVEERPAGPDRRKRFLGLSARGRALFRRLQGFWRDLRAATDQVLREAGGEIPGALDRLESALDRQPIRERLPRCRRLRSLDRVEILPYAPPHAAAYRRLLGAAGGAASVAETASLPGREGGRRATKVLLARLDGVVVGCAVLGVGTRALPEILLVAVEPGVRRTQVGRKLVLACLEGARRLGAPAVVARTAPGRDAATRLFRSLGFADAGPRISAGATRLRRELS